MSSGRGNILRSLLQRPRGVFAYGVSSPLSARAAVSAGHEAIYVGGYAAAALRGLPDMGILSSTEMLSHIASITDMVLDTPIIADIDDGYGSVHNVRRVVTDLLTKTSIAGFHIEDQKYPKRCGHIAGKEVLDLNEFLGKLQAAADTRDQYDPSVVIIARTDAFSAAGGRKDMSTGGDIDEAVRRGIAFVRAGADLVWCEFPTASALSARAFAEGMKTCFPPLGLAFNISPSFHWNIPECTTSNDLVSLGYTFRFATYPSVVAAYAADLRWSSRFAHGDPIDAMQDLQLSVAGMPAESMMKIVGVDIYQKIEQHYIPDADKRQKDSEGFRGN